MPIYALPEEHVFPDPALTDESGILAIGGDLSPRRLLLAYSMGIFPWYSEGQPILWHSPDPRFVLVPEQLNISRSLRRSLRNTDYQCRMDEAFEDVITQCARVPRPGQDGTWITQDMHEAYVTLHELGFAHSVETYLDDELVGGLYGVALGSAFFGESMFALRSDASKVAFVRLVQQLQEWGFELIDSQVYTQHVERLGAREIPRDDYLQRLRQCMGRPTRTGPWKINSP
ncbi:MAG TPA: leucyl/phenylalanyl-tRNA--protein transferase [Deltaproteobacteria bacterium]|nr:leucyl/phenylalanyl-tRNA--protein transferase [Deltaproteobacteria bacterium]HCP47298.1 leucyl/phenylalanyl-tRNA--protein transferase [Deltaproteobacteria bacterium]